MTSSDKIQVIKTVTDYKDALARIDTLMEADVDTPEGRELDALTDLVVLYENDWMKHWRIEHTETPYRERLFAGEVSAPETIEQHAKRLERDKAFEVPEPSDMSSDAYIRANVLRLRMKELSNSYPEGEGIPYEEILRIGYSHEDIESLRIWQDYWWHGGRFCDGAVEPSPLTLNMAVLIKTE